MTTTELSVGLIWPAQIIAHEAQPAHRRQPLRASTWVNMDREQALDQLSALPLNVTPETLREQLAALEPGQQLTLSAGHADISGVRGRMLIQAA